MKGIVLKSTIIACSLVAFTSCKNGKSDEKNETATETQDSTATASKITLEKLENSPAYADASLKLVEPKTEKVGEKVNFKFDVENYELGQQTDSPINDKLASSGKGQHIHFIVDDNPYSAHYTPDFEKDFSEGNHTVVAFLSRSYHEAVKNENSFVAKNFQVGDVKSDDKVDLTKPTLIYSRPKGEYSGDDTKNLLLDFFLLNTDLSENGNKVKATINGEEFEITDWQPYIVKGLPKGKVTVHLQLVDSEGNLIEGPYNDVTREVTLK
ncbi:hypothetical protein [Zunongwangia sp.]|uniref:hypothetical protein n=1 Tax=Zunongwangia sp. TaxID=1965325 RepID=UPI003AA9D321